MTDENKSMSEHRARESTADTFALTTPDPRFSPARAVTVNGYRYLPVQTTLGAIALLSEAAALFRRYEAHHRAKVPARPDPGEAGRVIHAALIEKANRNGSIAQRIEDYLLRDTTPRDTLPGLALSLVQDIDEDDRSGNTAIVSSLASFTRLRDALDERFPAGSHAAHGERDIALSAEDAASIARVEERLFGDGSIEIGVTGLDPDVIDGLRQSYDGSAPAAEPALYLIRKRGLYYRPNAEGYTASRDEAGRFTLAEAIDHSHPNGPDGPCDGIDYLLDDSASAATPAETETPEGVVVTQDSYTLRLYRCDGCACPTVQHGGTEMVRCAKPSTATGEWIAAPALAHTPTLRGEEVERPRQIVWREIQSVTWQANEDDAHATRLRMCAERRAQWGDDDCEDRDGSCDECAYDMAEKHETEASCAVRAAGQRILAALSQPLAVDTGQSGEASVWRRVWKVAFEPFDNGPGKGIGGQPESAGIGPLMPRAWPTIADLRALAATPAPSVLPECASSPDGKHQVDTSMESGPNNCFHCEAPMGGKAPSVSPDPAGEVGPAS